MRTVLQHMLRRKREYARLPFFDFLRDESLSARERLTFFPAMAPFIMSFGDLNRHVLRVEPTSDPVQRMINAHSREDDHHWPWYLEDFAELGYDDKVTGPCELMRSLWSDKLSRNRLLSHQLAHLIWSSSPPVRLALIEAIEETGHVLFALTARLAAQLQRESGLALRYLGEFHFALESGHAMNNEHAKLAAIQFDTVARREAIAAADRVFELFEGWTDELLAYAQEVRAGLPEADRCGVD